jgi:hypothetical protein
MENSEGGVETNGSNDTSGKQPQAEIAGRALTFCHGKSSRGPTQAEQRLLALMHANPGATIAQLAKLSDKSRPAIMMCLKRLKEAGLVDHVGRGSWTVADVDLVDAAPADVDLCDDAAAPPTEPSWSSWVTPLSGRHLARFTAGGRVRGGNDDSELNYPAHA